MYFGIKNNKKTHPLVVDVPGEIGGRRSGRCSTICNQRSSTFESSSIHRHYRCPVRNNCSRNNNDVISHLLQTVCNVIYDEDNLLYWALLYQSSVESVETYSSAFEHCMIYDFSQTVYLTWGKDYKEQSRIVSLL